MSDSVMAGLVYDLLVVLTAGLVAAAVCRRWGFSMLAGYLVVGALIGGGALGLVHEESHELKYLAEAGVLLLLFSVGIEFSFGELLRSARACVVGGSLQMVLVAAPVMVGPSSTRAP